MEQKRYIFLDIDGVVNHPEWYERIINECSRKDCSKMKMTEFHMDPLCVQRLNRLEGAEVVISSSWGYNDEIVNGLQKAGLKLPIIGGIDHLEYARQYISRGNSIAKWFYDNFNKSIPWDYCFDEDGWYHTEKSYSGTFADVAEGTEKIMYGENDVMLSYAIIDDDADILLQQQNHFVHVNYENGLTDKDIEKAKIMLNIR